MAIEQQTESERIRADRETYVARGVATTPLVVARAEGARIWDADGREYIDFAGGLGCQNTGHGFAAAAIHEQVDRYLHQCFMVGIYEPYIDVCRRLDDLWPGAAETRSLLVNSGAEAVENAVKIARAATGRPGVIVFDRAFHGRTSLTMAMTAKVVPYKRAFGPFTPEVHRAPAPYPPPPPGGGAGGPPPFFGRGGGGGGGRGPPGGGGGASPRGGGAALLV